MILIATQKTETFFIQSQKVQKIGYKTIHAYSYEEFLKILKDKIKLKLIIIDMDAIDIFPLIVKNIIPKLEIPLIYITDYSNNEISKNLYTDYTYGFLLKNSEDFILQSCIKTAINLFESCQKVKEKYSYIHKAELISRFGYWEFDLINKTVKTSKGANKIYGLDDEIYSIEDIKKFPLPEYREMLDNALKNLII